MSQRRLVISRSDEIRLAPLYGFVQLIDDGLKHSFVGGEIWPMKTGCEECQSSTLCISTRLERTSKRL